MRQLVSPVSLPPLPELTARSRLKKIKCLQPSPEAKCEACKAAKIQCRFRDRERYFAERSRAIAGPNSGVYATELRCVIFPLSTSSAYIPHSVPSRPQMLSPSLRARPAPLTCLDQIHTRLKLVVWYRQRSRELVITPPIRVITWVVGMRKSFSPSTTLYPHLYPQTIIIHVLL